MSSPEPTRHLLRRPWGAFIWLGLLALLAIGADFLATDLPWKATVGGATYFPVFQPTDSGRFFDSQDGRFKQMALGQVDWPGQPDLTGVVWAPVPYGPASNIARLYLAPGNMGPFNQPHDAEALRGKAFPHRLGSTGSGGDLLAALIHGSRTSLLVGLVTACLIMVIGIGIGALAGWLGDDGLWLRRGRMYGILLGLLGGWFWGFRARVVPLREAALEGITPWLGAILISILLLTGLLILGTWAGGWLSKIPWFDKLIPFRLDFWVLRLLELMSAFPSLLLLIALSVLLRERSLWLIMLIIGLTGWPGIARLTRAEVLRVRQEDYVQAAQALGLSRWRILWRHILPNALTPVWIMAAFVMGGAIMAESVLSFLGLTGGDHISWGQLFDEAQVRVSYWWMMLFPGLCIFATVFSLNQIGEYLRDWLDPRSR